MLEKQGLDLVSDPGDLLFPALPKVLFVPEA